MDDTGTRYYHFDELGSTRLITDEDGDVTDKYAYDAWGGLISHQGTLDQPYQYVGRLGYYTHHQDPDFSLLQLGVRFYDTQTGRFTQRDPARDGVNWYEYVVGNPIILIDPTGTKWICGGLSLNIGGAIFKGGLIGTGGGICYNRSCCRRNKVAISFDVVCSCWGLFAGAGADIFGSIMDSILEG